jgi:hypothetical protein
MCPCNTFPGESYTIDPARRSHILVGGYLLATRFITIEVRVIGTTVEHVQSERIVRENPNTVGHHGHPVE